MSNKGHHKNRMDLTGQRYGRLTVKHRLGQSWLCVCDCGKEKRVLQLSLRSGATQSCGCLAREMLIARNRLAA
jgi:hypothetical protein